MRGEGGCRQVFSSTVTFIGVCLTNALSSLEGMDRVGHIGLGMWKEHTSNIAQRKHIAQTVHIQ